MRRSNFIWLTWIYLIILLGLCMCIYGGFSGFLVLVSLLGICRCSRELYGSVSFLNNEHGYDCNR